MNRWKVRFTFVGRPSKGSLATPLPSFTVGVHAPDAHCSARVLLARASEREAREAEAVEHCGFALQFAPPVLREDLQVAMKAVRREYSSGPGGRHDGGLFVVVVVVAVCLVCLFCFVCFFLSLHQVEIEEYCRICRLNERMEVRVTDI